MTDKTGRTLSLLLATGTALGLMALTPPASAETITGAGCDEIDYRVTTGTTVVLTFAENCQLDGPYAAESGSPTFQYRGAVEGFALLWHQSTGRASASSTCPESWNPSWAQWMNDGNGGYTCDRVIDWGAFAGNPESVSITVNTVEDLAFNLDDPFLSFVFGCEIEGDPYDDPDRPFGYPLVTNCPTVG